MRAVIVKCDGSGKSQKPANLRTRNRGKELVAEYNCPECGRVFEREGLDPALTPQRVVVKLHARKELQ